MKKYLEAAVIISLYVLTSPLPLLRKAVRYFKGKRAHKPVLFENWV